MSDIKFNVEVIAQVDELVAIQQSEKEDWESSRLAGVLIDLVESYQKDELTIEEYKELLLDIQRTELMEDQAEEAVLRQRLVKAAEVLVSLL